jgi:hypothetical protein
VAIDGVTVIPAQSCAWLHATWRDEHVRIYGSKTDYVFVATPAATELRARVDDAELQTMIQHVVALYEAKTTKALRREYCMLDTIPRATL